MWLNLEMLCSEERREGGREREGERKGLSHIDQPETQIFKCQGNIQVLLVYIPLFSPTFYLLFFSILMTQILDILS